jgi:hypothetical protein
VVTRTAAIDKAVATRASNGSEIEVSNARPLACVLGGIDIVQALGLAGTRSTVFARAGGLSRYSRFTGVLAKTAGSADDDERGAASGGPAGESTSSVTWTPEQLHGSP